VRLVVGKVYLVTVLPTWRLGGEEGKKHRNQRVLEISRSRGQGRSSPNMDRHARTWIEKKQETGKTGRCTGERHRLGWNPSRSSTQRKRGDSCGESTKQIPLNTAGRDSRTQNRRETNWPVGPGGFKKRFR